MGEGALGLVVLAAVSLVVAGAAASWVEVYASPGVAAKREAQSIAEASLLSEPHCFTAADLVDASLPVVDPWGAPWRIECDEVGVTVSSAGADHVHEVPDADWAMYDDDVVVRSKWPRAREWTDLSGPPER